MFISFVFFFNGDKDETVPERDFHPKKRPRVDEEETENINVFCHILNQSEVIETNGLVKGKKG
jgi:hypothetical protein